MSEATHKFKQPEDIYVKGTIVVDHTSHPELSSYDAFGLSKCPKCGAPMKEHAYRITNGGFEVVCKGDIARDEIDDEGKVIPGKLFFQDRGQFDEMFESL